jgi:hypothetical protein
VDDEPQQEEEKPNLQYDEVTQGIQSSSCCCSSTWDDSSTATEGAAAAAAAAAAVADRWSSDEQSKILISTFKNISTFLPVSNFVIGRVALDFLCAPPER